MMKGTGRTRPRRRPDSFHRTRLHQRKASSKLAHYQDYVDLDSSLSLTNRTLANGDELLAIAQRRLGVKFANPPSVSKRFKPSLRAERVLVSCESLASLPSSQTADAQLEAAHEEIRRLREELAEAAHSAAHLGSKLRSAESKAAREREARVAAEAVLASLMAEKDARVAAEVEATTAARRLQAVGRGCAVRRRQQRENCAATAIQASSRGAVVRRVLLGREAAAVRIQVAHRRRVARWHALKRREAAACVQATVRGGAVRRTRRRQAAAATSLQSAARGMRDRKIARARRIEVDSAAVRIQAAFRGKRGRAIALVSPDFYVKDAGDFLANGGYRRCQNFESGRPQYERVVDSRSTVFTVQRAKGALWVLIQSQSGSDVRVLYAASAENGVGTPPAMGWTLAQDGLAPPPRLVEPKAGALAAQETAPRCVDLDGAGSMVCNGSYFRDGVVDGVPAYENVEKKHSKSTSTASATYLSRQRECTEIALFTFENAQA